MELSSSHILPSPSIYRENIFRFFKLSSQDLFLNLLIIFIPLLCICSILTEFSCPKLDPTLKVWSNHAGIWGQRFLFGAPSKSLKDEQNPLEKWIGLHHLLLYLHCLFESKRGMRFKEIKKHQGGRVKFYGSRQRVQWHLWYQSKLSRLGNKLCCQSFIRSGRLGLSLIAQKIRCPLGCGRWLEDRLVSSD